MFRPLDIVKFKTAYGMVTTSRENVASVVWFDDDNRPVKNAWWNESELTVCGNFIEIIANAMDCDDGHIDKRFLQGTMFMSTKGLEVNAE